MKTNEDNTPWEENPRDQKVDSKNYKTGVDQLERDVLRFLELIPDIKMAGVRIATNIAFPLASESTERAITAEDLLSENAPVLLEKLGIPNDLIQKNFQGNPSTEDEETFKRIVSRYLGAHSKVQVKIPMDMGLEALELAVRGTEGGFGAQASDSTLDKAVEVSSIRKVVASDARMNKIRYALQTPKFVNKFQTQTPSIPLQDIEVDKDRFLKQTSTGNYPLYGTVVIEAVVRAADEEAGHQGVAAITKLLVDGKYAFYDEQGNPLDPETIVHKHIQGCTDCSEVQAIKIKAVRSTAGDPLFKIPGTVEHEVLLYADKQHQGFAAAYDRVKGWADFPDFKQKVSVNKYVTKVWVTIFSQIHRHTAGCAECGKRTAHILLSRQQRQAISGHHHLKFITGHYGSGKVKYS